MTQDLSRTGHAGISATRLQRGLRINILAGALGVGWWVMTQGMPLTMFMEALGASGFLMGLVTTVLQLAFLMQVPAAIFTERLRARKPYWGAALILHRALWFLPPLLLYLFADQPALVAKLVLYLLAASALLGQSVTALWFSWMADLIPDRVRGRFWGARQSWVTFSNLVCTAVAGYVLDYFPSPHEPGGSWWGFSLVFLIGAVMGVTDIVIHLWVPEPPPYRHARMPPWFKRVLEPLRSRDFRTLTLAMGIYTFSMGLMALGIVCLKQDFHVTYSQLAALNIAAALGTLVFGFISGYAMDRTGGRAFCAIMVAVAPVAGLSWFLLRDYSTDFIGLTSGVPVLGSVVRAAVELLPHAWAGHVRAYALPQCVWIQLFAGFFAGALYGGIGLTQFHLAASLAPREGRTMAMAVHWSLVGVIGALGSVCAGKVMDLLAAHPVRFALPGGGPFLFQHALILAHMGLMWIVVLPTLLRLSPRKGELPFSLALSRLLVTNPFRTVANIYAMGAPVTGLRRARAVHTLGEERAAIAVSDLIEKLEDPSADVREAAVYALGSIGSPEAIDALVVKLEDPESDLGPQVAKALRASKSPKSVEALLRKLGDPDRETRTETARALGEIGDRRAVPSLMDLLSESKDSKVVSASSDALARLGELAAIYEILPRMRQTRNPVLKRSLAVAVGDLLGQRDEFYKVLVKEQETYGSEAGRMLKELGREMRGVSGERMASAARTLAGKTAAIQALYEERRLAQCAAALFDLAIGVAALRWGVEFGGDSLTAVHQLIWRDQRFGVGVWYLEMLRTGWDSGTPAEPDFVDILLGIYFLYCQGLKNEESR